VDLSIEVNSIPISVNKMYGQNGRRRFLTKEASNFKNLIKNIYFLKYRNIVIKKIPLYFSIKVYSKFINNGKVKRVDVDNYLKICQDAFFEAGGIDDKWVFGVSAEKINSEETKTLISLKAHIIDPSTTIKEQPTLF